MPQLSIRGKCSLSPSQGTEGAYYLLCRALFAAGRYQEILEIAEAAIEASGEEPVTEDVYIEIARGIEKQRWMLLAHLSGQPLNSGD